MAELGWLGVSIPEEYGGSGGGLVDMCLFLEETARGQAPIGGFGVSCIVAGATERYGTDEQKQDILGGIVAGNVEAIAMSEPGAGSDVGGDDLQGQAGERLLRRQRAEDVDLRGPPGLAHPARLPHRHATAPSTRA